MHTVNRSLLVSELPPLKLDDCSISSMANIKSGKLLAVEEVVEAGKFYDVLTIESAHGVGKIAMSAGFTKTNGFAIDSLLGYCEAENQWFDLGVASKSGEQRP